MDISKKRWRRGGIARPVAARNALLAEECYGDGGGGNLHFRTPLSPQNVVDICFSIVTATVTIADFNERQEL